MSVRPMKFLVVVAFDPKNCVPKSSANDCEAHCNSIPANSITFWAVALTDNSVNGNDAVL